MSDAKFCPNCGGALEPNSHFCANCGAKSGVVVGVSPKSGITVFLLCLFLGSLGVHRFYVGKIGTGLLMLITGGGFGIWYLYDLVSIVCNNFTDNAGNVVEIAKDPTTGKKVAMIIGALMAGFILLICTMLTIVMLMMGDMVGIAKDQLAAMRAGQYDKAYSYTSIEFQQATSLEQFKNFINTYPVLKNNVDVSFTEREFKNDNGQVKGTLTMPNGDKVKIEVQLVKENGVWKVLGIGLNMNH